MRQFRTVCAILALSVMNTACTPWPIEGTGGFAERHSSSSPVPSQELIDLADRLNYAIERGARTSYAAQTAEAELQLTRAQRTWDAGFVADYARNYQLLDVLIKDVEAHIGVSPKGLRKRVS